MHCSLESAANETLTKPKSTSKLTKDLCISVEAVCRLVVSIVAFDITAT